MLGQPFSGSLPLNTKLYKDLYDYAIRNDVYPCAETQKECTHASWVKANAIIYLIGLMPQKDSNDFTFFEPMNSDSINFFSERAYNGLSNLNPNVKPCILGGDNCGIIRSRAMELIQYLQAYDLLKTGGKISPYAQDASSNDCSPRNKLRQLSKELYVQSDMVINSESGWKKNHGIIAASALGMAAIVLNDAGVERGGDNQFGNIIRTIFNAIRLEPLPHPKYSPINWWNRAYGRPHNIVCFADCEDGLHDNFFVGQHNIGKETPQTNADGTAGYAEGPGYFLDLSHAFFPFLRCADNYLSPVHDKNLLHQEAFKNILKWYQKILIDNNYVPTYDNTEFQQGNLFGVLGTNDFPGNPTCVKEQYIDLRGDYLFALGGLTGSIQETDYYHSEASGNIVLRNSNKKSRQSFYMQCEKDYALDIEANNPDDTHEDDDLGSFMIYVSDSNSSVSVPLAIDPPYFGWGEEYATKFLYMHNVLLITTNNPSSDNEYKNPNFNKHPSIGNGLFEFSLTYDWKEHKNSTLIGNAINRHVINVNKDNEIYYILNDYVDASNIDGFDSTTFIINGNGNADNSTYHEVGNLHLWTFPCNVDGWSLVSHHISLKGGLPSSHFNKVPLTKNNTFLSMSTKAKGISNDYVTRLLVGQKNDKTIYQSFIYPHKCTDSLPQVFKTDTLDFVSTRIHFFNSVDTANYEAQLGKHNSFVTDTSVHLHLSRWDGGISDSLSNPFNLNNLSQSKLYFDCQKAFINYHTLDYMGQGYKYCPPTYAHFRHVQIADGKYLIFKDTLVLSSKRMHFQSSIYGRQNYQCYISPLETPSSSDTIIIKLPDVSRGVDMEAISSTDEILPSRYDSLHNYFYLAMPSVNTTFTIREKQDCNDCYFPPVGTHIDSTFSADDGLKHTLGNKKKINYPEGNFIISNATRIDMCEGVYLYNKDSLIITGPPQSRGMQTPTCQGIDSIAKASNNSMLIVSPGSALVLDAGSRTYVKTGAAIYVKQNGSLIVKDGAFLQIGDSSREGWGEIIAEPGAFIYIEPDAHIEYRRMIGDTADRNLFKIATGTQPAYAGVYYWMDSMLKAESIIASTIYPIDICNLDSLVPLYNKDWGYTNFAKPVANLSLRNDTLCPGEPLYIRMNRILNDAMAQISVCRWDSIFINGVFKNMVCVADTVILDSIPPDPTCRLPRTLPDEWWYFFDVNTRHQVSFTLMNECGRVVDTSFLVVVRDTPHFSLSVPATACEGYQTVMVHATESTGDSVYYTFEATEMADTATLSYQLGNQGNIYSKTFYGIVPDSFDFPDYYFRGGRTYSVSLSITNACGTSTQTGTVNIPSGVYIQMERSTLYANPVHGARSVQLHGYISTADSFRWEPSTWLNRTDTLVVTSTPEDSMAYILIARKDECTATDTAIIRVNHAANAGVSDTICYNSGKVLLGNAYDMSVFLGYLYVKGGSNFRNAFIDKTTADETYFRYFTLYMQTQAFKDWATTCSDLYTDFTENLYREATIQQSWFIPYFELFTAFDNAPMTALDTFAYHIGNDAGLSSNYSSVNDWGNLGTCINTMITGYDDFLSSQLNAVSISWTKISGTDTTYNGSLQEAALAVDAPAQTSTYIQNVITESYAEIDQTIIWVDTLAEALFAPQFQFDSTVVFQDLTLPVNAGNTYSWDFGDGSSASTEQNPVHEFPAFDTSFVVCLTVTNNCGFSSYCDTIYIDSAHWGGSFSIREQTTTGKEISFTEYGQLEAMFYPNPTASNGILVYQSKSNSESGVLTITDAQGRLVYEKSLNKPEDKLNIPTDRFATGLYYYIIQMKNGEAVTGKISRM